MSWCKTSHTSPRERDKMSERSGGENQSVLIGVFFLIFSGEKESNLEKSREEKKRFDVPGKSMCIDTLHLH